MPSKTYTFLASAELGGVRISTRPEIEADSEPEAIYEARKRVFAWVKDNVPLSTRDLKEFRIISVRR